VLARLLESAAGLLLALVTLRDVCDTVIVPGGARGSLKLVRRFALGALPLRKRVWRGGIGVTFAPLVLLAAFVGWMLLLVLAFGLMMHGLRDSFVPPLSNFGDALYAAGSALGTIGIGNGQTIGGPARFVLVAGGLCGLAVMTMAITYLLQVQSNVGQRDTGVLKLTTSAGQPPSALALLERYGGLGLREELANVLRNGRDWCAGVMQSHVSHPSLIYFRSAGTGSGWPAVLGTLVDLTLVIEHLLDAPELRGPAILLREQAAQLAREVSTLADLQPVAPRSDPAEVAAVCARLRAAGYPVRAAVDVRAFLAARTENVACIDALSEHLGLQGAPLLPAAP
jgi:hypothetical protein